MMQEHLISVVIPVYNGGRCVQQALRSALDQSWSRIEVLVVDDGSTDDTEQRVREVSERDERVRLLHHDGRANRGVSRSRKLALDQSCGDFVAFLDADDMWHPAKLERQLAATRDEADVESAGDGGGDGQGGAPKTVLCHTGVRCVNESRMASSLHFEGEFNLADAPLRYDLRRQAWFEACNRICLSSVLCRAEPLRRVARGFNQLFQYEDWTWWTLLSAAGAFIFLPEPLTIYRVHDDAATAGVQANPLREVYSRLEHWLTVAAHVRDRELREVAMRRVTATLADAACCYAQCGHEPAALSRQDIESMLDRAALLQQLGKCEQEVAQLRRFWPRRLVGLLRRWRRRRLARKL